MSQLFMRRPGLDNLPRLPDLPPGLGLREYRPGDEESIAELLRTAFEDDGWTVERVQQALIVPDDVKTIFVIADGEKIVATASVRLLPDAYPDAGYVHWVAASPDYKGQRLGYIVSLAVLHEFVRLGCQDAVLETDDFRLPAIKTYRKLGFEPVNRDETHSALWALVDERLAL